MVIEQLSDAGSDAGSLYEHLLAQTSTQRHPLASEATAGVQMMAERGGWDAHEQRLLALLHRQLVYKQAQALVQAQEEAQTPAEATGQGQQMALRHQQDGLSFRKTAAEETERRQTEALGRSGPSGSVLADSLLHDMLQMEAEMQHKAAGDAGYMLEAQEHMLAYGDWQPQAQSSAAPAYLRGSLQPPPVDAGLWPAPSPASFAGLERGGAAEGDARDRAAGGAQSDATGDLSALLRPSSPGFSALLSFATSPREASLPTAAAAVVGEGDGAGGGGSRERDGTLGDGSRGDHEETEVGQRGEGEGQDMGDALAGWQAQGQQLQSVSTALAPVRPAVSAGRLLRIEQRLAARLGLEGSARERQLRLRIATALQSMSQVGPTGGDKCKGRGV